MPLYRDFILTMVAIWWVVAIAITIALFTRADPRWIDGLNVVFLPVSIILLFDQVRQSQEDD